MATQKSEPISPEYKKIERIDTAFLNHLGIAIFYELPCCLKNEDEFTVLILVFKNFW